ncbi:MAG TPA: ribose-phosphate pyrophosphokinase [Dehalococcoidia bacterium]
MSATPPLLFAGSANHPLAAAVADALGTRLAPTTVERFPDGEVHIELRQDPRGREVVILQPTSPPPDEHLFELLAMADACRRAGAARITAVMPYFGYARQDRRAAGLEAVSARLVADLLVTAGVQRVIAMDPHTQAIDGFFVIPIERVTAVPALADALRPHLPANGVVVAPDLGAAKLAETYGRLLDLPVAIVHKTRTGPEAVSASRVSGDVRDKVPIIVDDMISTGGTIEAALWAVVSAGAQRGNALVAATHGLFVGSCVNRLKGLEIKRLFVTDSVALVPTPGLQVERVTAAPILAAALNSAV